MAQDPRTVFLGQGVVYDGQVAHKTFREVPSDKKIELPVAEEMQMGLSIGLALTGKVPITFYPRMDFLLLAMNQLVNHLDKLPMMGWKPKVLVRVAVGRKTPLDPGPQHCQNYTNELKTMLKAVRVLEMRKMEEVVPSYMKALAEHGSFVMVEHMEKYQ